MSLPSRAYLFKNGNIVANTFVNVGWFIEYHRIIDEAYGAYNSCLDQEKAEADGSINDMRFGYAYIFDGWKTFDHIKLYDWIIPRTALDEFFKGVITKDEFVQRFKDGSYLAENCGWYKNTNLDKLNEDYNAARITKYGEKKC